MDPLAYLHLQLRLEGKSVVNERFMRQVEVVPDEEMPLMLIAQFADQGLVDYYDETIAPDLYKELAAHLFEKEFPEFSSLLNVLRSQNMEFDAGHYRTYLFDSQAAKKIEAICLSKHDVKAKAFGFDVFAENVYGLERDGSIVSACVSVRENEKCGEAWVYTDIAYRNQGFAQKVVNAWASSLMEAGKVPFYSHRIENTASANLAGKLGLQPVFEEIAIIKST